MGCQGRHLVPIGGIRLEPHRFLAPPRRRLHPFPLFQHCPRDDHSLDLAGAFVDGGDADVAVEALHGIFAAEPVGPVDLHRRVAHRFGGLAGVQLGHAGGLGLPGPSAGGAHGGRAARQQPCGLDLRRGVGDHELDGLVVGDGLAEGMAFPRILDGLLEGALGDAHGLGRDADA